MITPNFTPPVAHALYIQRLHTRTSPVCPNLLSCKDAESIKSDDITHQLTEILYCNVTVKLKIKLKLQIAPGERCNYSMPTAMIAQTRGEKL